MLNDALLSEERDLKNWTNRQTNPAYNMFVTNRETELTKGVKLRGCKRKKKVSWKLSGLMGGWKWMQNQGKENRNALRETAIWGRRQASFGATKPYTRESIAVLSLRTSFLWISYKSYLKFGDTVGPTHRQTVGHNDKKTNTTDIVTLWIPNFI